MFIIGRVFERSMKEIGVLLWLLSVLVPMAAGTKNYTGGFGKCISSVDSLELDVLNERDKLTGIFTGIGEGEGAVRFLLWFVNSTEESFHLSIVAINNASSEEEAKGMVVWTAKQSRPVSTGACLNFSQSGDLELRDEDQTVVWSTNTSSSEDVRLGMTNKGNIWLKANTNGQVLWQSADHPSDSLMLGRVLKPNVKITSASNNVTYSLEMESHGLAMYKQVGTSGKEQYWNWSSSAGDDPDLFAALCVSARTGTVALQMGNNASSHAAINFVEQNCSSIAPTDTMDLGFSVSGITFATFLKVMPDGDLRLYAWDENSSDWKDQLEQQCKKCGPYTICKNGSCTGCVLKCNIRADAPCTLVSRLIRAIAGVAIGLVVLVLAGLLVSKVCRRTHRASSSDDEEVMIEASIQSSLLTRFHYSELKVITSGFSQVLGQGAFGTVYRGVLEDGTQVAVKKLENAGANSKEFLAEIASLARNRHWNLVQLLGYSAKRWTRLLVYEYMANSSLEKWIFNDLPESVVNWKTRLRIAKGTARGLAYLHEEASEKIIHLDLKPQNILLDEQFNPKIGDFGLSKLMGRDRSFVMTTMRGTPGYIAPEWLEGVITEKVDVFSFGVVLLELVTGRRGRDFVLGGMRYRLRSLALQEEEEEEAGRPGYDEDSLKQVVDQNLVLEDDTEVLQVRRALRIGVVCIQFDPLQRPAMTKLVQMLDGTCPIPKLMEQFSTVTAESLMITTSSQVASTASLPLSGSSTNSVSSVVPTDNT